jgi:hypothetical protein
VALSHAQLAVKHDLTQWLGGGFGMFSTADMGSSRKIRLTADDAGIWRDIPIPSLVWLELDRLRALPTEELATDLLHAARRWSQSRDCEIGLLCGTQIYRVEVWSTIYSTVDLSPEQTRLAAYQFEWKHGG